MQSATGDVYLGKEDHVLRKAHLEGKLRVARKDRSVLGGMTSATLALVFAFVLHLIGALKANRGEWWRPPMTLRLVR